MEYEAAGRVATACAEYKAYAEECAAAGRYSEAITCLLKVDNYGYLDIEGRKRLAGLYILNGRNEKAAEVYKSAAEDLAAQGKPDDALETLRRAVAKLPDQTSLIYDLARLYEDLGISAHAVSLLMEVIHDRPDDTDAMLALANIYRNRNSIAEAVDMLMRAAEVHERRGDTAAVAEVYRLALEYVPDNLAVLKKLVDIYRELGDDERVVGYMHMRARVCLDQGTRERALNIYAAIMNLAPGDETARKYVGDSVQFVSVIPRTERPAERPAESKPGPVEGLPAEKVGEGPKSLETDAVAAETKTAFPPDKPVRTAHDLLGFDPEKEFGGGEADPQVNYDLGLIYLEMGLTEAGIGYLQEASRDPALRVRACNLLGLSFLETGMPEVAVKEFERGLETPGLTEDEVVGLSYNLATAYEAVGNVEAALDELRRVYSIDINYLEVKRRLEGLTRKQLERPG
ncbi:MAG: tetratricopeptide repeat protein [Candidatus Coatesbacteria bacterium]|nr:MAG: tetratricopeptide repeat protein [Candidatus Coatesbacteria bacterium]